MLKNYGIAVVFGGRSNENEVSVITGTMVCNVLKKHGESVFPIYIAPDGEMYADESLSDISSFKRGGYMRRLRCFPCRGGAVLFSKNGKPKTRVSFFAAINCCHGGAGEGGGVAGAFALCGVPFASAGLFESAAFMDKYLTKLVLSSLGAKTAPYRYSRSVGGAVVGAEELGYPVVIKPCKSGSSIGITKADTCEELLSGLKLAFSLDDSVIIEKYLSPKREVNCAVYLKDGEAQTSPLEEVFSSEDTLSYDDKYSGGGERTFPADMDGELSGAIREETARIYTALNMRGIVRFDYIIHDGEAYICEINTVPGSLSQKLLSPDYDAFYAVLRDCIRQAESDFNEASSKKIIRTGILDNIPLNACKIK